MELGGRMKKRFRFQDKIMCELPEVSNGNFMNSFKGGLFVTGPKDGPVCLTGFGACFQKYQQLNRF